MRELYFVSPSQYGFAGKNYFAGKRFILKITSGDKRTCRGGVYEEHSGYIPLFLEGVRIRISQKTMSCLISRKFFGGKNKLKYLFGQNDF